MKDHTIGVFIRATAQTPVNAEKKKLEGGRQLFAEIQWQLTVRLRVNGSFLRSPTSTASTPCRPFLCNLLKFSKFHKLCMAERCFSFVKSMSFSLFNVTAILSCRYGSHEKSWEIGLAPLDLKSRPSSHCLVRRNPRQRTNFHFGPVEGGFPGQRTTTKAPSLHTNCNWLRPQGLKLRPQGLKAFSSKLFNLASSSLGRFRLMNPRWKAWNPSKATAPVLFPWPQGNER